MTSEPDDPRDDLTTHITTDDTADNTADVAGLTSLDETISWDAIVVAGGRATRLGGVDKTALDFEGLSLLEHAIAAVSFAHRVCVVGEPSRPASEREFFVRENPPFGGPASAVAAAVFALAHHHSTYTVVLAGDLPRAEAGLAALLAGSPLADGSPPADGAPPADGVVAVDGTGRRQPLLAVYRTVALRGAVAALGPPDGLPLRALLRHLDLREVAVAGELCADVDSPADAARLGIALPDTRPSGPPT
ncbi:MAG: NTP transferase domain-containing protein [Burkholderiaceae bacterium]|nr:NTP transferase domain-containing protein [Microbacteriaceae bacterium]